MVSNLCMVYQLQCALTGVQFGLIGLIAATLDDGILQLNQRKEIHA